MVCTIFIYRDTLLKYMNDNTSFKIATTIEQILNLKIKKTLTSHLYHNHNLFLITNFMCEKALRFFLKIK
jgi:hypothetical protein